MKRIIVRKINSLSGSSIETYFWKKCWRISFICIWIKSCSWRYCVMRDLVLCQHLSWCSGLHGLSCISCWQNRRQCLCVYEKLLHIDPYGEFFSVSCILWEKCGEVLLSNNCTVIIIGVYRPPDKSKIPECTIKLNKILSLTSQSDHVFIVGNLNINLLDPIAIENDFINNCHTNSIIPLINKPTRNANNNPSIIDHIWTNQLYDTLNSIFLLDITDHDPIFTIAPINCPQKRIRVKFRDHTGQNLAKLKIEVEHYLNNHVQINHDVSANTSNFCNNLFVSYSQSCTL